MTRVSWTSSKWFAAAMTLPLFIIWSNSFVAIGFLLGSEAAAARFDFIGYTVARYLASGLICVVYCFGWRPRESARLVAAHWRRLLVCGFVMVPGYNLALGYAQANGVSASIASLTTALNPLFMMLLSALFLNERIRLKHLVGLSIAFLGMVTIGSVDRSGSSIPYALALALVSAAPLSWAIFSVVSKPVAGRVPAVLWTYLSITFGGLMLLPLLGRGTAHSLIQLDGPGWLALLYLVLFCTVFGFAMWIWLLQHFSATSMGFTVFLNPPLTTISKLLLATFFPSVFLFQIQSREWIGGGLVLLGMALALVGRRRPRAR